MQHVERAARPLREQHAAADRRLLDEGIPYFADVRTVGLALPHVLGREPACDRVVFGMDDVHAAVLGQLLHDAEPLAIVGNPAVGGEGLDRRQAQPDGVTDLLDVLEGDVPGQDRVEDCSPPPSVPLPRPSCPGSAELAAFARPRRTQSRRWSSCRPTRTPTSALAARSRARPRGGKE